MPLPDDDDVVTRPNFAVVINSVVLSPISSSSSSSSSSSRITTTTRIRSLCSTIPHQRERERERSKAVPFFIVLVKSTRHFCVHSTEEQTSQSRVLRRFALSFFFLLKYSALKKKILNPK